MIFISHVFVDGLATALGDWKTFGFERGLGSSPESRDLVSSAFSKVASLSRSPHLMPSFILITPLANVHKCTTKENISS